MGTFTISYFVKKIFDRPKWHWVWVPGLYLGYRYFQWKRHCQLTAIKGRSKMYKSRREEIQRWDPNADIWRY